MIYPVLPFLYLVSLLYYTVSVKGRFNILFILKNHFEIFRNTFLLFPILKGRVRVLLSEDFSKNRGKVMMVTLHFGIWEYLPQVFERMGYRVTVLVSRYNSGIYRRLLDAFRRKMGIRFKRHMDRRENFDILGMTIDNFFKRVKVIRGMKFSDVPFLLSRRFNLPVFPVLGWRESGCFFVEVGKKIKNLEEGVEWCMKRVEGRVDQFLFSGKF